MWPEGGRFWEMGIIRGWPDQTDRAERRVFFLIKIFELKSCTDKHGQALTDTDWHGGWVFVMLLTGLGL